MTDHAHTTRATAPADSNDRRWGLPPVLRCGRVDEHAEHDWSRPPGWSRPRRVYRCEGAPMVAGGEAS